MTSNVPEPIDPRQLRVSDADRDQVAERLRDAAGEGRLALDELEDRITAVYTAKTYAELEPITRDLPAAGAPGPIPAPAAKARGRWRVGMKPRRRKSFVFMGGSDNKGAWVVPKSYIAFAMMGGIELDLREAEYEDREVTINASCIMGGIEIIVPDGLNVQVHGFGFMGGYSGTPIGPVDPDAPTLHVRGFALMGGVDVKRKAHRESKQDPDNRLDRGRYGEIEG
ncbi:DUF1707 and DUF2154 domain-containing protein [Catenulispora sp. NF23]|uniref:DUF1707 and DUF2154 domain-containing protein n=1 Tax=Catenulispora pinistramenti TaxID=2705254 RepID=A0ABS5L6T5_9ACTN|nr:DUF1707 domain-containing protein [Catenulispora pinistramenti]MBS2538319.1 DUF1707 and DUF2154 domain-containing protein [Catenulispora pinistramenti]MBS2553844.1 DUF1707 and DUF2154 domain-containing protein [Catenulispora pinistramenti]